MNTQTTDYRTGAEHDHDAGRELAIADRMEGRPAPRTDVDLERVALHDGDDVEAMASGYAEAWAE